MPLTVYNQDDSQALARGVYDRGKSVGIRRIGDPIMGGYFTANSNQPTALGTQGAAGCQIIIVHKRPGVGALGHYAGHTDPMIILRGLEQMVAKLGGGPLDAVLYAAGTGTGGAFGALGQKFYELTIIGGTMRRYPGVAVSWPLQNPKDNWGSAVYLPLTAEVALFHDMPGKFEGAADGTQGVTAFDYEPEY